MAYKKSEVSAAQIVKAAISVLARQGYAKTSLQDIASEAGMSKGAIHYHYSSKDALMRAVLETATTTVQERTVATWSAQDDPFSDLRRIVRTLWAVRREDSEEARVVADLVAQALYHDGLRPQLADYYRLAAQQIRDYLEERFVALGIRPKISLALLPRLVIGMLDGLVMQALVDDEAIDPDQLVDSVVLLGIGMFSVGTAPVGSAPLGARPTPVTGTHVIPSGSEDEPA